MSIAFTPHGRTEQRIIGCITNKHPVQTIIDVNSKEINAGNYALISWNELTKEEFELYGLLTTWDSRRLYG
ncbi:hypothetical protein KAR91_59675 [Candidatus Pacearchaeota archaeon]|nr:hypothetical protein [Candidatus Pacearchaeota archaeon]